MTRGLLIGEIIDNLSNLNNQVNLRCNLGFTDLNKFSEDFFAKLLNHIYSYGLKNLNTTRSNEPGLDLGDESSSVAFQVTSQAGSTKINSTLEKISDEQKAKFGLIKILIIGQKQGSYPGLNQELVEKFQFTKLGKVEPEDFIDFNIVDTKDLLRDIVTLDIKKIHEIYKFIKDEIQNVVIELEVSKSDGTFPTSLLNSREVSPETKALNGKRVSHLFGDGLSLNEINGFFDKLASIPRVTREIYYFIIDEGTFRDETFNLYYDEAVRKLSVTDKVFRQELTILERNNLIFSLDDDEPVISLKYKNEFIGYMLNEIKTNLNLKQIIVNLDFTKLDK